MSNGLFEVLAGEDASEQERIGRNRAVIAVQTRAKERFEKYVSKAANQEEREARIEVITSDLDKIAEEVVLEHHFITLDEARAAGREALGGGHPADCTCGFCKNKGNLPGSKKDDGDSDDMSDDKKDESADKDDKDDDDDDDKDDKKGNPFASSAKDVRQTVASAQEFPWDRVAADVETGDTFAQDRVDVATGPDASPKIDKGKSGDETGWDLKPIDVPSNAHPVEQQSAEDRADYGASDFDPSSPTRDRIDADAPLQAEHNVADNTETWTGTEGQASPVTSSVLSKWTVLP